MEGDESWVSDAPSMNPPMDTDREVGRRAKSPSGARKEQMGGQTLGTRQKEMCAPTNASALETGRPLWRIWNG